MAIVYNRVKTGMIAGIAGDRLATRNLKGFETNRLNLISPGTSDHAVIMRVSSSQNVMPQAETGLYNNRAARPLRRVALL